jgi:hypothetical protein
MLTRNHVVVAGLLRGMVIRMHHQIMDQVFQQIFSVDEKSFLDNHQNRIIELRVPIAH